MKRQDKDRLRDRIFYMVRLPSKKKKKKKKSRPIDPFFFSGMLPETFLFFLGGLIYIHELNAETEGEVRCL